MLAGLPSLQKLIRQLQRVPYLASKNVYRVAFYLLTTDQRSLEQLCQTMLETKKALKLCALCRNWTEENELCSICISTKRDKDIICVVETWHDLMALENAGQFAGVYHVLGGSLCPLEGVGPDQLAIEPLLMRISARTKELIFATNPTPEGEATASYIASKMTLPTIRISKLASGVPIGSSLEYMDRVTICKALMGRQPF
jgi:recombination protein RecR